MERRTVLILVGLLALLLVAAIGLGLSGALHDLAGAQLFESDFSRPAPVTAVLQDAAGNCRLDDGQLRVGPMARCRLGVGDGAPLVQALPLQLVEGDQISLVLELCLNGEGPRCRGGRWAELGDETLTTGESVEFELPQAGTVLVYGCRDGPCRLILP